ncbi:MAG: hypothetical protein HY606_09250, partial [Planctomycetes bacterium]|nr:hypothetical protein [Planctomycetota bacterium]
YIEEVEYTHSNRITKTLIVLQALFALLTVSRYCYGLRGHLYLDRDAVFSVHIWKFLTYNFSFSPDDRAGFFYAVIIFFAYYHFGSILEWQIGFRRYLKVCIYSLIGGAMGHLLFVVVTSNRDVIASGNMFPVLNTIIAISTLRFSYLKVRFLFFPVPVWIFGCLVMVVTVLHSTAGFSLATIFGGFVVAYFHLDIRRFLGSIGKKVSDRMVEQKLDAILQKINDQGMDSLTPAEKKFLEKASDYMKKKE